jgi:hypothetical protein
MGDRLPEASVKAIRQNDRLEYVCKFPQVFEEAMGCQMAQ